MSEPKFTALGVDVGGTKIAAGVVAFPEGVVRARREIPTLPQRGGAAVLARRGFSDVHPVLGAGMGSPLFASVS